MIECSIPIGVSLLLLDLLIGDLRWGAYKTTEKQKKYLTDILIPNKSESENLIISRAQQLQFKTLMKES